MVEPSSADRLEPIHVVGFGARASDDAFVRALAGVGYAARPCAVERWLAGSHEGEPAVLLLSPGRYDSSRIVQRLELAPGAATLGVLWDMGGRQAHEIARACSDFVFFPCTEHELGLRLSRLRKCPSEPAVAPARGKIASLVGSSPAFVKVLAVLERVAKCDAPVLVVGETGTGKEVAARAVHYLSARRDFPFVPVNCGAIPDQLFENELFGHERGAYTDARREQVGLVTQAEGGTLFLDEVGTLSHKGQCALLRFLQNCEYKPLGSPKPRRADVRIVAATNADLKELVKSGAFREDLMYRLRILPVALPALRQREDDALLLARHFLGLFRAQYGRGPARLSPHAERFIRCHAWPGNVRELENVIHRDFLLAEDDVLRLDTESLVELCAGVRAAASCYQQAKAEVVREFERNYLERLLERTGGNVSEAARIAGKERRALGRLIHKHGLGNKSATRPA